MTHLRTDEDLGRLVQSIEEVLRLDFDAVLCAHRGVVEDRKQALRDKIDWLSGLGEQARELQRQGLRVCS